jgi:hypothetical protein
MTTQRDIPAHIARWLFRIGIIWVVVLALPTIGALLSAFDRAWRIWQLGIYFLVGYGVGIGWRWRSRQRRALAPSAAFWLFSAVFNAAFIVLLIATESQWQKILIFDATAFYGWWWIAVTLASLVALAFEFTIPRHEIPAA